MNRILSMIPPAMSARANEAIKACGISRTGPSLAVHPTAAPTLPPEIWACPSSNPSNEIKTNAASGSAIVLSTFFLRTMPP